MPGEIMTRERLGWTSALAVTVVALLLLGRGLTFLVPEARAQAPDSGLAEGFEATEYYPEPYHTQLMWRIQAGKVEPHAGGKLLLSTTLLDVFHTNGTPAFSVRAPQCVYDFAERTANSTGRLHFASGDRRLQVEGEGFEWRQKDMTLNISNRVHTELRNVFAKKGKR